MLCCALRRSGRARRNIGTLDRVVSRGVKTTNGTNTSARRVAWTLTEFGELSPTHPPTPHTRANRNWNATANCNATATAAETYRVRPVGPTSSSADSPKVSPDRSTDTTSPNCPQNFMFPAYHLVSSFIALCTCAAVLRNRSAPIMAPKLRPCGLVNTNSAVLTRRPIIPCRLSDSLCNATNDPELSRMWCTCAPRRAIARRLSVGASSLALAVRRGVAGVVDECGDGWGEPSPSDDGAASCEL